MPMNVPLDLGITIGGGALWVVSELMGTTLAPSSCRWCDRTADGTDSLNAFDASARSLRWKNTGAADTMSTVFSFGLAPLAGFGVGALVAWHDDRLDELPADTLVVAESAGIAINLNQIAKFATARQRPDAHARLIEDPNAAPSASDNRSFFSGHATLAFALATSAGTVASMRGHRLAPVMWAAGLTLATTGAYLRIAADRHYATDVLTGAIVGSAVGFAVPYFAHRPNPLNACIAAAHVPGGGTLVLSGSF
jgi:membrane-associated phospholipid phosphatase